MTALLEPPFAPRTELPRAESLPAADAVVTVQQLHKVYGDTVAVADISLAIAPGAIFGLVGPNGAGKTTTIECIEGIRRPDGGRVTVLGMEPAANRTALFQQVGVQLQENSLPPRQRVIEAMRVFSTLYPNPMPIGELLAATGLEGRARAIFRQLSGGQKRRLLLALALIGNPRLLILDEPTSGLDPQAKHNVWRLLKQVRSRGTTILLTTHDMDEAQENCDTVCIVDHGRVLAQGSASELLAAHGMQFRASITADSAQNAPVTLPEPLLRALPGTRQVEVVDNEVVVYGSGGDFLPALTRLLEQHGLAQGDMETRRARLEDLFLLLTGRDYREG